jgi:hypothetical protein
MGNHFHLVLQTLESTLSRGMRQLNGVYGQGFNRRHGRVGHLFQGRFKAGLIEADAHLTEAIRYTLLNPVRAGLVSAPARWQWSSYPMTVGLEPRPPWFAYEFVLSLFADAESEAVLRFERFLSDPNEASDRARLRSPVSGSRAFVVALLSEHEDVASREVPRPERIAEEAIRIRTPVSDEGLYATLQQGLSMRAIAALVGCHYSTVSRRLARYEQSLRPVACKT